MADNNADDIIRRLSQLSMTRSGFERVWEQVANVAAPDAGDFKMSGAIGSGMLDSLILRPLAAERSRRIYDSTAVWAVDRLASGIEALVVPQSEHWHELAITDLAREDTTDEEKLYLQRLRNLMFKVRYDADTGWVTAVQTALRHLVAFGNAFIWVEEGDPARRSMVRYRYLPLNECFVAENHQGQIDTLYRPYALSARQALQKFGDRLSQKVKDAAAKPESADTQYTFIQCVSPRGDFGDSVYGAAKSAPFRSVHVEYTERKIVGEQGFYEWPLIDFRWLPIPGRTYGEGPVMKCLADIQSCNILSRNELVAGQQAIMPPLLVANAGIVNRPDAKPGAMTFGGMSPSGQRLVEPLMPNQRLDFATMVLKAKQEQIKESLYINLFAVLVKTPEMTATQAMIRANEKGELLGPAGARIQQGLSNLIERELGILIRAGLFDQGSRFAPPRSLRERHLAPQFAGPLDRLRRSREAEGTIRMLEILSPIAQVDPSVVDVFEPDTMARGLAEVLGMPLQYLRAPEIVAQIRESRAQQQQLAAQAEIAKNLATAGKQGSEAIAGITERGGLAA